MYEIAKIVLFIGSASGLALGAPLGARAEDSDPAGRYQLELSFDLGVLPEVVGLDFTADLRLHSPNGLGAVLRTGIEAGYSLFATHVDVGIAYRMTLFAHARQAVHLSVAVGPAVAYGTYYDPPPEGYCGPFGCWEPPEDTSAFGGWGMFHLDYRFGSFFVGAGVNARVLRPELAVTRTNHADLIIRVAPTLRFGGEWGL